MEFYSLISIFFVSFIFTYIYKKFAINKNIVANLNFRTLHVSPIPMGGGIVFSTVFVVGLIFCWWLDYLSSTLFLLLVVGGEVAAMFGFLDDFIDINAKKKLAVQILLSGWAVFWLSGGVLFYFEWLPSSISIALTLLFMVWMMNAYNFMDGIDGMAISGSVFVSATMIGVLLLTRPESEFIVVMELLLVSTLAFMFFNWPPASIFMGDAGSIFLGYIFGALILVTVMVGDITIWTWLVAFGYFFADTTMTQFMRVILVKKWYLPHRSHAYQNLARITESHLKVTGGVVLYNLIWVLPLTLWSALSPEVAFYAVALSVTPGMIVAYRYGPRLSSS